MSTPRRKPPKMHFENVSVVEATKLIYLDYILFLQVSFKMSNKDAHCIIFVSYLLSCSASLCIRAASGQRKYVCSISSPLTSPPSPAWSIRNTVCTSAWSAALWRSTPDHKVCVSGGEGICQFVYFFCYSLRIRPL